MQNVAIVDGVLCTAAWTNKVINAGFNEGYKNYQWTHPVVSDSYCVLIWALAGSLYAIDQYGYLYVCLFGPLPNTGTAFTPVLNPINPVGAADGPWLANQPPSAVQIINGVAYISNFTRGKTYSYDPTNAPYAINIATTYVGGKCFGVLDDYLLQFNTNSTGQGINANMVNWSGPGLFTTWDPSVNRTAGFNQLPAVEDELTGFVSLASTGLLLSRKSLVQLNPTGIAIGPFQFTVLWTSVLGQGLSIPETLVQYGQTAFLTTDAGVYTVGTSGLSDISGAAKTAIMTSLANAGYVFNSLNPTICGGFILYFNNTAYPTPRYVVVGINNSGDFNGVTTWIFDPTTGIWTQLETPIDGAGAGQSCRIFCCDTFPNEGTLPGNDIPITYGTFLVVRASSGSLNNSYIYGLQISNNNVAQGLIGTGPTVALNLVTRSETIKIWREPTIRRIVVRAYGSGTLNLSINGVSFGAINIASTIPANYISPFGVFTGMDPQLTVTGNFNGVIVKIVLFGTYADGEVD